MTKAKPPAPKPAITPADPYAIRSIEQLFTLFDGGEFLIRFMSDHRDLLEKMQDHHEEFGAKGVKGSFSIGVSYDLSHAGDLTMTATAEFKPPKKPASQAHAFVEGNGELTLHSPMMRRMHGGVRDAGYDPETGEVRDV